MVLLILIGLLRALVRADPAGSSAAVLSFGAALGLSALLFQYVFGFDTADRLPLYAFVFLVALGIDYNIFLMTRVREETVASTAPAAGSLIALSVTGGVITSAGLVLAATFLVLATMPMVGFVQVGVARGAGRAARHDDRAVGARDCTPASTSAARSGARRGSIAEDRCR